MKGFALTETLVATAIAGLIVTALVWLQVDYLALARRAVTQGRPAADARALQQAAKAYDNCGAPQAVLTQSSYGLAARIGEQDMPVLGLPSASRLRVVAARGADGAPRPGWSMASIERNGAPLAVLAQRCDLSELCNYDMATGQCRGN